MLWLLCFAQGALLGLWYQGLLFYQLYELSPDLKQTLYVNPTDGWLLLRGMQMLAPVSKSLEYLVELLVFFFLPIFQTFFCLVFFYVMVVWESCGGILHYTAQYLMGRDEQQPKTAQKKCHKNLLSSQQFRIAKAQIPPSGVIRNRNGCWPSAEENISLQVPQYVVIRHGTVYVVSTFWVFSYLLKKHFRRITLSQVTSLKYNTSV